MIPQQMIRMVPKSHGLTSGMSRRQPFGIRSFGSTTTSSSTSKKTKDKGSLYIVKAGLPLILFCSLGVWVVSSGIEGKNKERDMFQGRMSKSERQYLLEKEHDEMIEKLNHVAAQDFDNTKRIERPEEVLARRRKEREARNSWHRRTWRWITGQD